MLQKLHLRNFQHHKNLEISFEQVTTIVGPTDIGKSAILRALYWICFNKPSGKRFIRWGTKKAGVRLLVDGHTIERIRGTENFYKLDGRDFKAFGTGVPEPIEKILNIKPENIQHQIDTQTHKSCFWLTLSPPQVSRELNQIVDLSLLDNILSFLLKGCRKTKANLHVLRERLKQAREQKKELAYAKQMDKDLIPVETECKKLLTIKIDIAQLEQTLDETEVLEKKVKKHFSAKGYKEFQMITRMMAKLEDTKSQAWKLRSLLLNMAITTNEKTTCNNQLKLMREKLKKEMVGRCPICKRKLRPGVNK